MRKLFLIMMTLCAFSWSLMAQTRTVSGTVVDAANNEPLIGATIMPIGGGQGAATDVDGNFTLNVPSNVKTAKVSYVGYKEQTVTLTNNMVVRLAASSTNLDDVIVVAYGTAKKSAYTGSASVIKSETIENALVSTATDALNGKMAGVQVQSANGQPGTAPTIRIRGVGSINADNNPLYVLDGVPYDGDISGINTTDIESMTVLKDAAAAALYGARGANGVILITTKKGSAGDVRVTLDARWGVNQRAVPNYDVFTSTDGYMEQAYIALRNSYFYNASMSAEEATAKTNAEIFNRLGYQCYTVPKGEGLFTSDGKINPNASLGFSDGRFYYTPDDWYKEQIRDGLRQEYNLNVKGGNEKFQFYISGSYLGDQGLIEGSHFNRFATRAVGDYQITKWLKIGTNLSYTYTNSGYPDDQTEAGSSGNAFLMADQLAPYYPMYVRDASGNIMYNEGTGKKIYDYGDRKVVPYARNWMSSSNPAGNLVYDTEDYLSDLFNGKWYINLTPIEGLSITGSAGLFIDNTRYHNLGNPYYGQSADYGGSASQYFARLRTLNLQALANYARTFAEKHDIDILLGYETYDLENESLQGVGYNLYLPDSWVINNTIDNKNPYGNVNKYGTRGIFGRANYTFDSRYFFSFSVRRDASSRFAPDKRWGTFWSVSGGWNIAGEKFMESSHNWLDQLKFKISFGQQGNDNVGLGYYPWQDQYKISGGDGVWSDGVLYRKGNKDLTWETSNNFNVGFDFSFLKGMVYGTIEYFNRQTSDMLYNKPVPPSLGYSSIPMNIGSMRNNGVELELNVRPIENKNVTWDINFNITSVNNKVLELHPDLNGQLISGSRIYREGESMYNLYLVQYAGVDPATGLALYWDAKPMKDEQGNPIKDKYGKQVYGDEFLTTNASDAYSHNRKATGNIMPKAYGGFGTNVSFFGVDLSLAFAYQFGGKIIDYTYQSLMHNGGQNFGQNWHKDMLNAWTPENPNTNVPRLDVSDEYTNYTSDRFLVSSNYLSLNNVTLGYTLPKNFVNKLRLQNVRVYCSAENVFLISARKGMDPRQGYVSSEGALYKASRCISGGIHVEF
ncbi:MAG: TonB-dependent receptor [Muribaculaceae bacterium]|nr:TonB-dependent receptor [Muribaculaceae bacterium]